MTKNLIKTFYKHSMFFSANGKEFIESPNIMVQEIHKSSGVPRKNVIDLFKKLVQIDFIEKVPEEKYSYRIKNKMSLKEIQKLIE